MQNLFENNGAIFSECRKYRYALWRIWDAEKKLCMFIGLNPSTANGNTDDNTIRRIKKIAFNLGFGGVYMMNLFAYVSRHPEDLQTCADPIGDNDKWLKEISCKCDTIIFAWGAFVEAHERSKIVVDMFLKGQALVINKNGSPRHPLYVKGNVVPVEFNTPPCKMRILKLHHPKGHPYWDANEYRVELPNGQFVKLAPLFKNGNHGGYEIFIKHEGCFFVQCASGSGYGKVRCAQPIKIVDNSEYDKIEYIGKPLEMSVELKSYIQENPFNK